MSWVDELSDSFEPRRFIHDLVALSALPDLWCDFNSQQMAESVAGRLASTLDEGFIYVRSLEQHGDQPFEVMHAGPGLAAELELLRPSLLSQFSDHPIGAITLPNLGMHLRVESIPVGLDGNAVLVAGDSCPHFPTEAQRILFKIGADQLATGLHLCRAETSLSRFTTLVANSSELIGFASLDGWPHYLNSAGMKLVGLESLEQLYRTHLLDFISPADRGRARDEIWPMVMQAGRWVGELALHHFGTGASMPFLVDWMRIDDPHTGKPMNHATVSRDLSAEKASDAQLRYLNATLEQRVLERTDELADVNAKLITEVAEHQRADGELHELQFRYFYAARLTTAGQMAASLAHELNQPLTAVAASVTAAKRLLARSQLQSSDEIDEALGDATLQALRAGQIIQRLRGLLSRGETEPTVEDLSVLIREAAKFGIAAANGRSLKVILLLDPDIRPVLCDRVQIQQVIVNLLKNAAEAIGTTRPGVIRIEARQLDERQVEVAVSDNGPGLPQLILDRPFEPFISTKSDGMGLGLSICRSIVEAHRGKLSAEPAPDGGTIFRFSLSALPHENS